MGRERRNFLLIIFVWLDIKLKDIKDINLTFLLIILKKKRLDFKDRKTYKEE